MQSNTTVLRYFYYSVHPRCISEGWFAHHIFLDYTLIIWIKSHLDVISASWTLVLTLSFHLLISSSFPPGPSSQMGPPRLTVSQALARAEEAEEGPLGSTQTTRGPPNASTCPTSPSASETPTYGRCLGYVDSNIHPPFLFFPHLHHHNNPGEEFGLKAWPIQWRQASFHCLFPQVGNLITSDSAKLNLFLCRLTKTETEFIPSAIL